MDDVFNPDDNWCIDCSDEESFIGDQPNRDQAIVNWHPPVDEIVEAFTSLHGGDIPNLEWQCPGRRAATPTHDPSTEQTSNPGAHEKTAVPDDRKAPKEEFDFADEAITIIAPRRSFPNARPKKKVADFSEVVQLMRREYNEERASKHPGLSDDH